MRQRRGPDIQPGHRRDDGHEGQAHRDQDAAAIAQVFVDQSVQHERRQFRIVGGVAQFDDGIVGRGLGLQSAVDHLDGGTPIILADMGAGAGQVAADWFDSMYDDVADTGVRFTAVGVVTPDPASVESVLAWANRLQDRVEYVVVENATSAMSDFTYWRSTEQANRFRAAFEPEILQMEFRLAELENPLRQHGIQLGQVADRKAEVDELKRASLIMRAQSYRRRLFSEFDRAKQVFLP